MLVFAAMLVICYACSTAELRRKARIDVKCIEPYCIGAIGLVVVFCVVTTYWKG